MLLDVLAQAASQREQRALARHRRIAATPCAPRQTLHGDGDARTLLQFSSNDYLGLANHPDVVAAFAEGARQWGAGSGASHLVTGHSLAHHRLESALSDWMAPIIPQARALYFCTGYMANLGVLTSLGGTDATLFCESLNHASLIDGARLARAAVQRYPHGDVAALDALLSGCGTPVKLIVTDGVFSMDGDIAPLAALLALAERHDAWLVVDDAHGFGVLGDSGRGVLEALGLCSSRLIYIGTLGKAAGVAGAFVAAHPAIVDHLVNTARTYIYTTAAPPAVTHALMTSLALIGGDEGARRRAALRARIGQLRAALAPLAQERGWQLPDSATAIQPLIVGDNGAALALSADLEAAGIRVGAIRPPTVPEGTARLRITLSAAHGADDVARLLDALRAATPRLPMREVA